MPLSSDWWPAKPHVVAQQEVSLIILFQAHPQLFVLLLDTAATKLKTAGSNTSCWFFIRVGWKKLCLEDVPYSFTSWTWILHWNRWSENLFWASPWLSDLVGLTNKHAADKLKNWQNVSPHIYFFSIKCDIIQSSPCRHNPDWASEGVSAPSGENWQRLQDWLA